MTPRNTLTIRLCLTFPVLLALGPAQVAHARQRPQVRAETTTDRIHLDGRLDEPAWERAGRIHDLTQQEPKPGAPTPYPTEVRALVDDGNLYLGFVCRDPDPGRIAVHTMRRDGDQYGDDSVIIALDPFGHERTGYFFRVNAVGARQDGLISGPEDVSTDWDGIWDARARRTGEGWTVEIRIPAQSLRFPPGCDRWGFNVERTVARDRTVLRWTGTTLDAQFYDLRRAGWLTGVGHLHQGRGLSVSPYALGRNEHDFSSGRGSVHGDVGADVTYNLTPDMTCVLTGNTDFAETEVDTRRINLTRFPLFFPEKRAFFLQEATLFEFGSGLGEDFIPFFSRRIGLYEEEQVPLDGGVKLLGRTGQWNLGVLDVVAGNSSQTERTNLFAGRATYDAGDHLTFGAIATHGDPDGVHDNTVLGADVQWQTSSFLGDKNFSVGGWGAHSTGDVPRGSRAGWGLKVDYPNDLWDLSLLFKRFGDGLDPALGFLPRPGTRWYEGGGAYQPRPGGIVGDWIRQMYFETYFAYVENLDGRAESWQVFLAPFNVSTESGEHLEANFIPQFERLDEPFEVAEGVEIPPGDYHFRRFRVQAESSPHRPWWVGSTLRFGAFYTGSLAQWESSAGYTTPGARLQLTVDTEHDFGWLPQGDFIQRLWKIKTTYSFSPDFVVSSYVQYDSESRNLGTNNRLRWTFRPGNDLYVVWNRNWERSAADSDRFDLRVLEDRLVVKLRWTFRS